MRLLEQCQQTGDMWARHGCSRYRLEELTRRSKGRSRRVAGQDQDSGCGHVGLDDVVGGTGAQRPPRREGGHRVPAPSLFVSVGYFHGGGSTGVGDELLEGAAVGEVDVHGGHPMVVGEEVLGVVGVVENHAGSTGLQYGTALLDAGRATTQAKDHLPGEIARESQFRIAQLVAMVGCVHEGELSVGSGCDRGTPVSDLFGPPGLQLGYVSLLLQTGPDRGHPGCGPGASNG